MAHLTAQERKHLIISKAAQDASRGIFEKPHDGASLGAHLVVGIFAPIWGNAILGDGLNNEKRQDNEIYKEAHALMSK